MPPHGVHSPRRRVSSPFERLVTDLDPNAIDELLAERDELARENALLQRDNEELSQLLQDYGTGLEAITELIRDHAVLTPYHNLLLPQ
jgi:hypothetical protein